MSNFKTNIANKPEFAPSNEVKAPFVQVLLDVVEDLKISAQALRLYLVMLAISKGFPSCWPPQALLAAKLGVSERSVRQYLKELQGQGLIEIEHRGQPGQNLPNLYHLKKLVSSKQAENERKNSSAPTEKPGSKIPPATEKLGQEQRQDSSAVIYESKIHESIDLNTHATEPRTGEEQTLEGVCENVTLLDKFDDQETETEQAQSTIRLIEQQLKLAGVSAVRAKRAAQLICANGRTSRYIEQWQRWIATQRYIQNPAAYLLSRIQENTNVPRENISAQNRLSSWSQALSQQVQTAPEQTPESDELSVPPEAVPISNPSGMLKLIVDNTARPPLSRPQDPWDYPEEFSGGLRLVVNNPVLCDDSLAGMDLSEAVEITSEETTFSPVEQGDVSQKKVEAENNSVRATQPVAQPVKVAPKVDLRLKELMMQRDERIKRVKRLEVVGDTLYVAFWFRHEAEAGVGQNWLADAKWFYPEACKVELG